MQLSKLDVNSYLGKVYCCAKHFYEILVIKTLMQGIRNDILFMFYISLDYMLSNRISNLIVI